MTISSIFSRVCRFRRRNHVVVRLCLLCQRSGPPGRDLDRHHWQPDHHCARFRAGRLPDLRAGGFGAGRPAGGTITTNRAARSRRALRHHPAHRRRHAAHDALQSGHLWPQVIEKALDRWVTIVRASSTRRPEPAGPANPGDDEFAADGGDAPEHGAGFDNMASRSPPRLLPDSRRRASSRPPRASRQRARRRWHRPRSASGSVHHRRDGKRQPLPGGLIVKWGPGQQQPVSGTASSALCGGVSSRGLRRRSRSL